MTKPLCVVGVIAVFVAFLSFSSPLVPPATTSALQATSTSRTDLKSPAGPGSAEPNLAAGRDGRVYMTWIEPSQGKGNVLQFSVLQSQAWSAPKAIARGENWFVNPADFPSLAVLPDGTLAAHWLVLSGGPDSEAYDINLAFSKDSGTTWAKPVVIHRDRKKRQHGFVSFAPMSDGKLAAIWLDGRNMQDEEHGDMALMYTTISSAGVLGPEAQIDNRVCECCQTALTPTPDGFVAVYRDRSAKEIRDISLSRFANGKWSAPEPLSKDNWEIDGCPINGPAVSSSGKNVAIAWFTAPDDKPSVNLLMSSDAAKTFGKKIRIDAGNPAGRVDVETLPTGEALVSWIERTSEGSQLHLRQVSATGTAAAPINVSGATKVASGGFPKIALSGNQIVAAWTDSAEPSRVHTTLVTR